MKKQVQVPSMRSFGLKFFTFLLMSAGIVGPYHAKGQAVVSSTGFEANNTAGFLTQDANETDSVSTSNVRTGIYGNRFVAKTATAVNYIYSNSAVFMVSTGGAYIHGTYWAKLAPGDASTVTSFLSFMTTSFAPPIANASGSLLTAGTSGTPVTLSNSAWTQVHFGTASMSTGYMWPCINRGTLIADSIFIDDFILYTSSSATDDILAPLAPTALTAVNGCPNANLTWTSNTDNAATGSTGVKNTIILRTTSATATGPVMNNQATYSVTGGAAGPNTVNDATTSATWTIVNTAVGATATGYGDNAGAGTYKYAVVLQDYAFNYSAPAVTASTVTLNATPTVTASTSSQSVCNGAATTAITFTPSAGATVSWKSSATSVGTAATGSGNIASFTAVNTTNLPILDTVTATPSIGGCPGTPILSVITANPTPVVNSSATSQTVCNGTQATLNFGSSVTGSTFAWTGTVSTIGIGTSGTGSIGAFTATNATTASVVDTIKVTATANSCVSAQKIDTIVVKPSPGVTFNANTQTVCSGTSATLNFTPSIAGTTYAWTGTVASIGIAASGTANIGTFTTTNTTQQIITDTIKVTPTVNGCTGTQQVATIIVNPIPATALIPATQSICNNTSSTAVVLGSGTAGTTFTWTNNVPSIGIAATGSTSTGIASFTAVNTGNTSILDTVTFTPTANGCVGLPIIATITVKPTPVATLTPATQTVCAAATNVGVAFTNTIASGTTYAWTGTNTAIGLPATGTASISGLTALNPGITTISDTIRVTPTNNGCVGAVQTAVIVVNPSPTVTVSQPTQTLCNGATTTVINFTSNMSSPTYAWTNTKPSIGLVATGSGSTIAAFTAVNTGTAAVKDTVYVTATAAGCPGVSQFAAITVNPTPAVTAAPSAPAVCNGVSGGAVTFSSTTTGATYAWTNTNPATGLAANGTGNIAAFTAVNTGSTAILDTIMVTPTANSCAGTAQRTVLTVNPTPVVTATPSSQSVCNNTSASIAFTSTVTGTTYAWTNSMPIIGIAASGTANIGATTVVNPTSIPDTALIVVTPTANSCAGAPVTATLIVKPTPVVTFSPTAPAVCNGVSGGAVTFSSNVTGATYAWTNSNPTIGLAGSGTSNIAAFTGVNAGTAPVFGSIQVTPTASSCVGAPQSFTVTVNPTPTVTASPSTQTICPGITTASIGFTSPVTGATYSWSVSPSTIGLSNGTGATIAGFAGTNTTSSAVTGTITITPTANGCTGITNTATVIVNPAPVVTAAPTSLAVCHGVASSVVTFTSVPTGATYSWTNNNNSIGLAPFGTGNLPSFIGVDSSTSNRAVTATVTVTPTGSNSCVGATQTVAITINPIPYDTISLLTQTLCNTVATTAITFTSNVTGTTYAWSTPTTSIGIAASGTGNIASFTGANTTNAAVTATITVIPTANGCAGPSQTATITVKPTPIATATPATQAVCNGIATTAVAITSTVSGTTYAWTNNTTSTGIPASGTSNTIASVTGTNTSTSPATSPVVIIPTANGCAGASITANITVNPIPVVSVSPANQAVCNGANTRRLTFSSTVSGSTYAWTNNNTSIGLAGAASSGTGNVAIFAGIDTSATQPVIATFSVIPTANSCAGLPLTTTITINPTPSVILTGNPQTLCDGFTTSPISFGGSIVSGTTYSWTNDNTNINLAASGTGNIPAFTATNTTGLSAITGNIVVTPMAASCPGPTMSTTITVNPTPVVTVSQVSQPVCNGATTQPVVISSNTTGAVFTWTNNNPAVGLIASGTNNTIPAFTAVNTTNAPVQAIVTVGTTAFGCIGANVTSTIVVNPTPTVTATPTGQTVCNNSPTAVIFAGSLTGPTTFNWTSSQPSTGIAATGTGSISVNAINTGSTPVTTTITVTPTANGCPGASQTATVTVNPTPSVTATPATQSVCTGKPTTRITFTNPVAGTTYAWSNNNTSIGLIANSTGNIASFAALNTTPTPVTATINVTPSANGCVGTAQPVTITVNPYPIALANASAGTASCTDDSVTLTSNTGTGYTYQWNLNGATLSNAIGSTYFAHASGTYTVTVTSRGCATVSNQIPVLLRATPPAPIYNVSGRLDLCPTDTVVLGTASSFNPPYSYQWQYNGTDIPGANNVNLTVSNSGVGSYDVKVSANGCDNVSSVITVTGRPAPPTGQPIAATQPQICPGGTDLLQLGSMGYAYQWYLNNILIAGAVNTSYTATAPGTYTVGITSGAGCTVSSLPQTIVTAAVPTPTITVNGKQLCTAAIGTYQWYLNGVAIATGTHACYSPGIQNGGYTVAVTNSNGCTGTSATYFYSTGVSNVTPETVKLYPNPATNVVNISAPQSVNVTISTLDGKQLINAENVTSIDISKLANAVYLMKVYDRDNTLIKVEKLVKAGW